MKLSIRWRWTLVTILLIVLSLLLSYPVPGHIDERVIGTPSSDLFDEIYVQTTITRKLLQTQSPLSSDYLNYPNQDNFLASHWGLLHFILAAPLVACLPWPQWWNVLVLTVVVIGTLAACYTLVKLSRNWVIGLPLGISFLSCQWLRARVSWGHLAQLWTAPLYLAIYFLVKSLTEADNRRYCWGLGIFTLITAFIYWIWGLGLALLGFLGLIYYWPELQRHQLKHLGITVAVTALIAIPAAGYIVTLQHDVPNPPPNSANSQNVYFQSLKRASDNAAIYTYGQQQEIVLSRDTLVAPILSIIAVLSFILACKKRSAIVFWSTCAYIFLLIGWGPFFRLGSYSFINSEGQPVLLPYFYLMDWGGLGYRWQTPHTATPILMMCLALATAFAWSSCQRRYRMSTMITSLLLTACLLGISVQGVSSAGSGNKLTYSGSGLANPALPSYFPSFTFRPPAFIATLRSLPRGAMLELPLGFVTNVWQLQQLHGLPTCHGLLPVVSIIDNNDFVLWMYRYSRYVCNGLPQTYIPDPQSAEVLYGQTELPQSLWLDRNRYANITRSIDRQSVERDYNSFYQELGVKYAVLHRANCSWLAPGCGDQAYERLFALLEKLCGAAIYSDNDVAIFAWPSPEERNLFSAYHPWEATLTVSAAERLE